MTRATGFCFSMRNHFITFFVLLAMTASAQTGPAGWSKRRIDSIERRLLNRLIYTPRAMVNDSIAGEAVQVLEESRQIGYIHGIALALGCQSAIENERTGNSEKAEQLALQSLNWFDRTDDKNGIMLTYYSLGFTAFAQIRFTESLLFFDQARHYARRSGARMAEVYILSGKAGVYREQGDYAQAFDTLRQCIQTAQTLGDSTLIKEEYTLLAELLKDAGEFESADRYFHLVFGRHGPETLDPRARLKYAEVLTIERKYDSALSIYDGLDSAHLPQTILPVFLASKGEFYFCRLNYASALPYFVRCLGYQEQIIDRNQKMRCLGDLASVYIKLHQNTEAFRYVWQELALAEGTIPRPYNARRYTQESYFLLFLLHQQEHHGDSALFYYNKYLENSYELSANQLNGRLASFELERQIRMLNDEKRLEDGYLRQETLSKRLLIAGIIIVLLLAGIYMRNVRLRRRNDDHRRKQVEDEMEIQRLEGERTKAQLQQRTKELEIRALRSQMNPHFIFNCLNAINRFILGQETEVASDYLTKFSRLMRMIMNHSRNSDISLAEELDILRLYLDMERLRFKNAFDYQIVVEDEIDIDDIRIPPLLMQPFVENAVWHGLMQKEERGTLTIHLKVEGELLICVIRDNGIGRQKAEMLKSRSVDKHKSMGMEITAERMALLGDKGDPQPFFQVEDLYDERGEPSGTQVTLTIRIQPAATEPQINSGP
jgi:tetratricopeptide (TPR) repeat protein